MPNPYRKHTPRRRDSRRAQNWRLEVGGMSKCSHCGAMARPHCVCGQCGFYDGKLVVAKKEKKSKKKPPENGEPQG